MRQACVLEANDLETLKGGRPLHITLPGGVDFTILFDPTAAVNGNANGVRRSIDGKILLGPRDKAEIVAYAREHSAAEAAQKYGADRSSVYAWVRGEALGRSGGGRPRKTAAAAARDGWRKFTPTDEMSEETVEWLRTKWAEVGKKFSIPEFANRVGVTKSRLHYMGIRHGGDLVDRKKGITGRRRWTDATRNAVVNYYKEHGSAATLSKFKLSTSQISRWKRGLR